MSSPLKGGALKKFMPMGRPKKAVPEGGVKKTSAYIPNALHVKARQLGLELGKDLAVMLNESLELFVSMQADETGRAAFSDILRVWTVGKESRRNDVAKWVKTVRLNVDHELERAERTKQMPIRKAGS